MGEEDPEVRVMGVHLRVLGGRPVWPLAFHQLVAARDWCAFVEQRLVEGRDFLPVPLEPRSLDARHLEELLAGYWDQWEFTWMLRRRQTVCWRRWACFT